MRVLVLLGSLALALVIAAAPHAALADGPVATPPPRPPDVVLRHVDAPQIAVDPHSRKPELVILVGGFGSKANSTWFGPLETRLKAGGYDVLRFGEDDTFPYKTYGDVGTNARNLRDEIRSLSGKYPGGIHIVAHSMGGDVVDAALADGLSADDGVKTYVALSSPHSGSSIAQIAQVTLALAGDARPEMATVLGHGLDGDAARDLARATAPPAPDGIVRLDLREATDVTVGRGDMRDGSVPTVTLFDPSELDGHDAIGHDPAALDLVDRLITQRRVPTDDRSLALRAAAAIQNDGVDRIRDRVLLCLLIAACGAALGLRANRLIRRTVEPLWHRVERSWAWPRIWI